MLDKSVAVSIGSPASFLRKAAVSPDASYGRLPSRKRTGS